MYYIYSTYIYQQHLVCIINYINAGVFKVIGTWGHLHLGLFTWIIGGGNGNPLQYFCWNNLQESGACWASVHGITEGWAQLSTEAHGLYVSIYLFL